MKLIRSRFCVNDFPDDIDDDDQQDLHKVSFLRTVADQRCAGCPIDQYTAVVGDVQQHFFRIARDSFCSCC